MSVSRRNLLTFWLVLLLILLIPVTGVVSQKIESGLDIKNILPERQRAAVVNQWLEWRLENLVPELMRREGIDLWLVINREYNEDPVYMSMMPEPSMSARRTSILLFHDRGKELGVERLSGSYYGMGKWYRGTWRDKSLTQFESLAKLLKELNPKKIGINASEKWAFGDGLTSGLRSKLEAALGRKLSSRLVSAENLCIGWLETRSPQELSVYRHICGIAHDIISEFFSNEVIVPDITTCDDVRWWIRQRITDLGLEPWFHPSINVQRSKKEMAKYSDRGQIIRRGDLIHCDVGIVYLGLCTDMQWHAYVCHTGETDAPQGLKHALNRANRVGDIFRSEFKSGRSGNEITDTTMEKANKEGLRPLLYSHPIGIHGHGAGCSMDARPLTSAPEGIRIRMNYPLYPNTVYAIEYSATTSIPEWDNQDIRISYEENAVFTESGCRFLDGHQTRFYLIK